MSKHKNGGHRQKYGPVENHGEPGKTWKEGLVWVKKKQNCENWRIEYKSQICYKR